MKRSRPVSLALVGLFVWVSACTWHRDLVLDEVGDYKTVRVTTPDRQIEIKDPAFTADTLSGRSESGSVRVPAEDVVKVEASGTDVAATVVLVGVICGLVIGMILIGESVESSMSW